MPRKLRVEYPGAIYPVMSRGNRRGDIYLDEVDRQDFIKTLAQAGRKTGWQVHSCCLMRGTTIPGGGDSQGQLGGGDALAAKCLHDPAEQSAPNGFQLPAPNS